MNSERRFWKIAARNLPHHSLLAMSEQLNSRRLTVLLSKRRDRVLSKSTVRTYTPEQVESYQKIASQAKLWHGTGRLQYAGSEVRDVFATILKNNSLSPARDVYAVFFGGKEMDSISTTPLRMIARSYADTHGKGEKEKHRYGSSLWWVAYYYSLFYGLVFTKYSPSVLRHYSKWNKLSKDETGKRSWGKKVNTRASSVWDVFGLGSDIPGNYPILFGIKRVGRTATPPEGIREVEIRLLDHVHIFDLSHIEVPEDKVNEVKKILRQYGFDTAVFPIELGEFVASRQPFATLLGLHE